MPKLLQGHGVLEQGVLPQSSSLAQQQFLPFGHGHLSRMVPREQCWLWSRQHCLCSESLFLL